MIKIVLKETIFCTEKLSVENNSLKSSGADDASGNDVSLSFLSLTFGSLTPCKLLLEGSLVVDDGCFNDVLVVLLSKLNETPFFDKDSNLHLGSCDRRHLYKYVFNCPLEIWWE